MAINWLNTKTKFKTLSAADTILVEGYYPDFVTAIEDFFNNTPGVKDFEYVINWRTDGGIRSVEQQAAKGGTGVTGASGGKSAHNYGMAIDFAPVGRENNGRGGNYADVELLPPYAAKRLVLAEPWAVAITALHNHPTLYSGAKFSLLDYNHIEWKNYREIARTIAPQYWNGTGPGNRQTFTAPTTRTNTPQTQQGPSITPYITSMESLHPHIQYELTRRRNAAETANVHMPYARLTSLVSVLGENINGGTSGSIAAYCPTLGVHGIPDKDKLTFDEMYNPQDGRSIVGYATKESAAGAERVAVLVEDANEDPPNIPMPGIVSVSTDRNTAGPMGVRGGLFRATLNIRAYSLGQLNALLKYFLRPATRVVLELGRTASSISEQRLTNSIELTNNGITNDTTYTRELFRKFEWNRPKAAIDAELEPLVTLKTGQRDFIQRYIYNNFGDYEIFIGYVVSFKLKYTKENVYEIELLVHSVQQFEVPTKLSGTKPTNKISVSNDCNAIDISDYFNPDTGFRHNSFRRLLARCVDATDTELYPIWNQDVIALNGRVGTPGSAGIDSPGYLVSWKFFVDMILNDNTYGILSVFQMQDNLDAKSIEVLRAGLISRIGSTPPAAFKGVSDTNLNSNEVSWHKNLRSTDPNTMIIYNEAAQAESNPAVTLEIINALSATGKINDEDLKKLTDDIGTENISNYIKGNKHIGSFDNMGGTSYLTKGVWINSNAIIDAFSGSDTITSAITRLLNTMNNATQGFWNLQLLSAEPESLGLHVIDMGLSKPINTRLMPQEDDYVITVPSGPTELVTRFKEDVTFFKKTQTSDEPKYLYVFNRKSQTRSDGDMGSELLDINIDSSLPQVIAVQAIAGVGGVAQRGALSSIDIEQLKKISLYDVFPKDNVEPTTPCVGNAFPDRNTNKTLTTQQAAEIQVAIRQPKVLQSQGIDPAERIREIEKKAFDDWVTQQERSTQDQEKRKREITEDIQSIRNMPQELYERNNVGMLDLVQKYSSYFGRAIDLIETDISKFIKILDSNAFIQDENKPHPFNSSNLTKTIVDLTLPGIGGIQLFQAFAVARVPNILNRGYYVVTKVAHDFSVDSGWTTKIQGRFRFSPIPPREIPQ